LAATTTVDDVRALLERVASLTRQLPPTVTSDAVRPAGFASALSRALDGESRGDVLLNDTDVRYFLSFRDASDVPAVNRADVALLLRDGHLSLFPDATLRPRQPMSRSRVLQTIARALEARGLFQLQKATARPANDGSIVLRVPGKTDEKKLSLAPDVFLFRAFGDALFQVREVSLVGGEQLKFHTTSLGDVDYLEVRPSKNGASPDHAATYSNWQVSVSPTTVLAALGNQARTVGSITDMRVIMRGPSRRVLDLEVIGTKATAHIRRGRIRTALGLREQLFVIDRVHDEAGRVKSFIITGRGWGHGVGMCQVGAYGLARAGLSYEKILKTYYTGIALTKLY
jgi:stage II sporulation protein D